MLPIAAAVDASLLREREASTLGRAVLKLRIPSIDPLLKHPLLPLAG
jgi:hypothetical protein